MGPIVLQSIAENPHKRSILRYETLDTKTGDATMAPEKLDCEEATTLIFTGDTPTKGVKGPLTKHYEGEQCLKKHNNRRI